MGVLIVGMRRFLLHAMAGNPEIIAMEEYTARFGNLMPSIEDAEVEYRVSGSSV